MIQQWRQMIQEWWQGLSSRDQKFVLVGGIIAAILTLYAFVWSPLSAAVVQLRQQVNEQRQTVAWLQLAAGKIQQYHASGFSVQSRGNQPLITFLSHSLANNGLDHFPPKIMATDSNTVTMDFKQVPFDNLIAWLEKLWRNYGLDTQKITINTTSTSGLVRVSLVIAE